MGSQDGGHAGRRGAQQFGRDVMGAVKEAKIEGELFACDHFNVPEEQFIWMAADEFGASSILYDAAILEWNDTERFMGVRS